MRKGFKIKKDRVAFEYDKKKEHFECKYYTDYGYIVTKEKELNKQCPTEFTMCVFGINGPREVNKEVYEEYKEWCYKR